MGFSEKMRESLGAEGVRLTVTPPSEPVVPGTAARAVVRIEGGTRPAHITALVIRVVEADRHWVDPEGRRLSEDEAGSLPNRRHLRAGWDRRAVSQQRISLEREVEPASHSDLDVEIEVPSECQASSIRRSHTLNVQADIKGQIDPTANSRMVVGAP